MVKFEHGNHKIQSIRNNCVVVSAGDVLAHREVLQAAEELLEELRDSHPKIRQQLQVLRDGRVRTFLGKGMYLTMP